VSTETSKRTVVIDLDNTLADYVGGWDKHKDFPGDPYQDVVFELRRLKAQGWLIGILTTRPTELTWKWINTHNLRDLIEFVNDNPHQPKDASTHKPIAFCYIDDRGIRFTGHNMREIVDGLLAGEFQPWGK